MDVGKYNSVSTIAEGSLDNKVFFTHELIPTGTVHLNGEQVKKTDIALFQENKEFQVRFGNHNCHWLTFQVEKEDLLRSGCVLPKQSFSLIRTNSQFKKHLVDELFQFLAALQRKEQLEDNVIDQKMARDHLISLFSLTLDGQVQRLRNDKARQVATMLRDYMEAHLDECITMMRLCELSGKSERTLRRIFNQIYGISPRAYLTTHRLNTVYRKLLKSEAARGTVSHIALQYGFLNLGRFSGEYKNHFGEYPSETLNRT